MSRENRFFEKKCLEFKPARRPEFDCTINYIKPNTEDEVDKRNKKIVLGLNKKSLDFVCKMKFTVINKR
jgi:hypothetical protein